jgi:two-component system chemotaxis response regulator CheB
MSWMTPRRIIAIGASAGGFEPLRGIVASLPEDLSAAVLIVIHVAPDSPGLLPGILRGASKLPVAHAIDGEVLHERRIYIAPPDRHMILDGEVIRLTRGPKENFSRPAIDPLFRSAAQVYGRRAIGVVLSGRLDDGTAGLWTIKKRGGVTVAQDPREASHPSMPRNACSYVKVDHTLPAAEIAATLISLTTRAPSREDSSVTREIEIEIAIAKGGNALGLGVMDLGPITPYTCPECHGVLVELREGGMPRFRCHTGHGYSLNSLLSEVTGYVETSLWNATRAIEEGILLMQHASRHLLEKGNRAGAKLLATKAKSTEARAQLLRNALNEPEAVSLDLLDEDDEKP